MHYTVFDAKHSANKSREEQYLFLKSNHRTLTTSLCRQPGTEENANHGASTRRNEPLFIEADRHFGSSSGAGGKSCRKQNGFIMTVHGK